LNKSRLCCGHHPGKPVTGGLYGLVWPFPRLPCGCFPLAGLAFQWGPWCGTSMGIWPGTFGGFGARGWSSQMTLGMPILMQGRLGTTHWGFGLHPPWIWALDGNWERLVVWHAGRHCFGEYHGHHVWFSAVFEGPKGWPTTVGCPQLGVISMGLAWAGRATHNPRGRILAGPMGGPAYIVIAGPLALFWRHGGHQIGPIGAVAPKGFMGWAWRVFHVSHLHIGGTGLTDMRQKKNVHRHLEGWQQICFWCAPMVPSPPTPFWLTS